MAYSPLVAENKEVRLLHLQPSPGREDPIQCHFSVVSLDAPILSYEALSYVWGNVQSSDDVEVRGVKIITTQNLSLALQYLRYDDRERVLWIDALSINQSDILERTQQVSLMSYIYRQAANVVVWLGEDWGHCDLAMEALTKLGRDKDLHILPRFDSSLEVQGKTLESPELQDALIEFFTLPWWTRIWTVQEFVLAQRIAFQCGNSVLEGNYARQAMRNIFDHQSRPCCVSYGSIGSKLPILLGHMIALDALEFIRSFIDTTSFLYTASQFRARRATDIRDKIFGILGLATGEFSGFVKPDYTASPEAVLETSTVAAIQRTGKLDVLSHIPIFGEFNLQLPSFVPDWTVPVTNIRDYLDWLNWLGHIHLFTASKTSKASLTVLAAGRISVRGRIVSRIAKATSAARSVPSGQLLDEMLNIANIKGPDSLYVNSELTRKQAFYHTLCGTLEKFIDAERHNRPFYKRIIEPNLPMKSENEYAKFEKWMKWLPTNDKRAADAEIVTTNAAFNVVATGRRFVVTHDIGSAGEYMGFAPEKCRQGDCVAVLEGAGVVFVLRERAEGREYEVLGDAYFQGLMDGEAWEGDDLQDFVLV